MFRPYLVAAILGLVLEGASGLIPGRAWGFRITSPVTGMQVEAGGTVSVQVETEGVGVLVGVLFGASGGSRGIASDFDVLPPYRWSFQLPRDYVGPVSITAVGQMLGQKTGEPPLAEVIIVAVVPSGLTLQALRVRDDQRTLFMFAGAKRKIRVYGKFSDGIERLISSASLGTTYATSDQKVATADADGLVTAGEPGRATITIKNGERQMQVQVDVKPPKTKPGVSP